MSWTEERFKLEAPKPYVDKGSSGKDSFSVAWYARLSEIEGITERIEAPTHSQDQSLHTPLCTSWREVNRGCVCSVVL